MSQPKIEELFDNGRLPDGLSFLLFILYLPLGLMLLILRFFIGIHTFLVACLLPRTSWLRKFVLRVMCFVLGILVSEKEGSQRDKTAKVLVANYRTSLDHLMVGLVIPCMVPCVWDLPKRLIWLLGYTDMGATQGRATVVHNASRYCTEGQLPLLTFPEGAFTNGKIGMLKFSTWPFSLNQPVQPVLITIKRPLISCISPSVLGGRWWSDILWTFLTFYTCYHIRLLPAEQIGDEETEVEFTQRVETKMAKELGIKTTTHTSADKVEYAKRKLLDQQHSGGPAPQGEQTPASPETAEVSETEPTGSEVMVQQVKEVLPHVPVRVIREDLVLTKDVDLTITNILEGRVKFTPEDQQGAAPSPPSNKQANIKPAKSKTAASSFGKSSKERQLSFEERKELLIQNARQKYMEKHNML